jgi:hypothetical protein
MATAVLESQTIIVLDNTKQLPMKKIPQEEQAVAESSRDDVKIQGFRSSVVHKPGSSDSQTGGLTVQDPPKGWPFSEINVNFNTLMSENKANVNPGIATHRPEQSRIRQKQQPHLKHQNTNHNLIRQQQEQLHQVQRDVIHSQQQNLHQHHQKVSAPVTNSNGFTQTTNSNEFNQPPPYIITANGHQQSGLVPGNSDQNSAKEPTEIIPKTIHSNTGLQTGYNFGFVTPPNTFAHDNQVMNVIKQEFSASGDDKLLSNQQQRDDSLGIHIQSAGAHNISPGNRDTNYVWRDISPGLEISSNAPQLAGGLHRNFAATRKPDMTSGNIMNSKVGGQSHAAHLQVPNFDHANALGHSANFGHRDAVLSTPAQFQANQEHLVTISQGHSAGVQEQENQYQNNGHKIQNAVSDPGNRNENIGSVVTGTNKNPGIVGQAERIPGDQYNHQQQQPEIHSVSPQSSYGVDVASHKVPVTLNKGLVQGIPGSLVLGNEFHLGYATGNTGQQNVLLYMQDMVNAGDNGMPLQAFYVPLLGLQSGQVENHQAQEGNVDGQHVEEIQRNHPGVVGSHMAKGVINTAPMLYVGLPMINGYAGFRGLPLLQGNLLGIQGLHGVVGGTHQIGGMFLGGNYFPFPDGRLALDNQNNLAHKTYKPALESVMQATGQHHNTFEAQGNQYIPMPIGKNVVSFENTAPYQYQQVNNQLSHTVRPQINVHPNGFALKIQHQHPIPQHNFNSGRHHKLPFGGNRFPQQPSGFPPQEFVLGAPKTPTQGYQTFPFPPISAANSQQPGFKLNPLQAFPLTQPPLNIPQEVPQSHSTVKRDENVSKPPAPSKLGIQLRDKNAYGWLGSMPGKTKSPFSNSLFPTNTRHVIGLIPPTTSPSFVK